LPRGEVRSGFAECRFGGSTFGHVLNCSDVLGVAVIAPDVSGDVYVLDRAVRHLQAEFDLHIAAVCRERSIWSWNSDKSSGWIRVPIMRKSLDNPVNLEDAIKLL